MIPPSFVETINSLNILITLICHLEPKPYNLETKKQSDTRNTLKTTTGGAASNDDKLATRKVPNGINTNGNSEGATVNLQKREDRPTSATRSTDVRADDVGVTQRNVSQDKFDGIFQSSTESHEFYTSHETFASNMDPSFTSSHSITNPPDSSSLGLPATSNTVASPNLQPLLASQFQSKLETTSPNEVTYNCSNTSCDANNTMDPLARLILVNDLTDVGEILVRNINLDDPYDWGYVICELQELGVTNTSAISSSKFFICSIRTRWKQFEYDWKYLFAILFIGAGGVGNILVCLAVCLDKSLQNVTNYFLLSLALADLLVSVIVMPLGAIPGFLGQHRIPIPSGKKVNRIPSRQFRPAKRSTPPPAIPSGKKVNTQFVRHKMEIEMKEGLGKEEGRIEGGREGENTNRVESTGHMCIISRELDPL
ncbi:hypothetical protein WDU94_002419 [Cyamophila willieti]